MFILKTTLEQPRSPRRRRNAPFFHSISVHFTIGHDIFPEQIRSLLLRRAASLLVSWILYD